MNNTKHNSITAEGFYREGIDGIWYLIVIIPSEQAKKHRLNEEIINQLYRGLIESDFRNVEFIKIRDKGCSFGALHLERIFVIKFTGERICNENLSDCSEQ